MTAAALDHTGRHPRCVPTTPSNRLVPNHPSTAPRPDRVGPRPDQVAARLAQLMAEVLVRARPAGQLEPLASVSVIRLLERRADPPVLATVAGVPRPLVRSLRVASPRPGAVEACAVIAVGRRLRALAFRLELSDARWICTAAQVG